jgi:hypothetical protein
VIVVLAAVALAGITAALVLGPAALLAVVLLFGRYPGERVIRRLRRRAEVVPDGRSTPVPRRPPWTLGARLSALAVPGSGRAPPAAVLI